MPAGEQAGAGGSARGASCELAAEVVGRSAFSPWRCSVSDGRGQWGRKNGTSTQRVPDQHHLPTGGVWN